MMGVDTETLLSRSITDLLLAQKPKFSAEHLKINQENLQQVISSGRDTDLCIQDPRNFETVSFRKWTLEIIDEISALAEVLDGMQAETLSK